MVNSMANEPILQAVNVTKEFVVPGGGFTREYIAAVDQVSLELHDKPTIISLVGESGSGKTTLSRMLLGLSAPNDGKVFYMGKDLFHQSKSERMDFYRRVQPVFQDPYGIYNPFYRIERVLHLAIKNFNLASSKEEADAKIEEALKAVDLRPSDVLGRYPHQLSGGQNQRIMLARIYLLRPKIIIADEPVSMIDVAIRTLFLNILVDFRDKFDISCLFITHNLSTAYYVGGQMMVLCFGRVVESGEIDRIIEKPLHPYTVQLLQSIPSSDPLKRWTERPNLEYVERPITRDAGMCGYVARCPRAMPICSKQRPPEYQVDENHFTNCFLYQGSPIREIPGAELLAKKGKKAV
jgi:oligopeptide/dipeptide ABC transporter ATP-binding protein